jgi:hypothetical protein
MSSGPAPQFGAAPNPGPRYSPPQGAWPYAPPAAQQPQFSVPAYGPQQLAPPPAPLQRPRPMQRPAVIGMAASMAVTASLLWVCALATAWLFAVAGQQGLASGSEFDGRVLLALNHFSSRLLDGLALPLFGLPALAFVAGFVLLARRGWARIVFTATGFGSLGWAAWWLHANFIWWLAPALYILVACMIVWTPAATAWYREPSQRLSA